ncbi:MAG: hypothetical protein ACOC44_16710 [Promethearchaeia archaeon]
MKKSEEESSQEDKVEIAKFLLQDTESLRNESKFTKLVDMVHPLTYTDDLKNHENLHLIPVLDKPHNEEIKKKFLKLYK